MDNNKDDSILLLVDSMTDATAKLIASHYDKTYIVDLRRYSYYKSSNFIIDNYLNENDIQMVLYQNHNTLILLR